jgi:hypothetical protein
VAAKGKRAVTDRSQAGSYLAKADQFLRAAERAAQDGCSNSGLSEPAGDAVVVPVEVVGIGRLHGEGPVLHV